MLGIAVDNQALHYAQLVDTGGITSIESVGSLALTIPTEAFLTAPLPASFTHTLVQLREKLEFPDRRVICVLPMRWVPHCFQRMDKELPESDWQKFLDWQGGTIMEVNPREYRLIHQELELDNATDVRYFISVALPVKLHIKLKNAFEQADWNLEKLILESEALGNYLLLDSIEAESQDLTGLFRTRNPQEGQFLLFKNQEWVGETYLFRDAEETWRTEVVWTAVNDTFAIVDEVRDALNGLPSTQDSPFLNWYYLCQADDMPEWRENLEHLGVGRPLFMEDLFTLRDMPEEKLSTLAGAMGALIPLLPLNHAD